MSLKKPEAVFLELDDTMVSFSIPRVNYWNAVTTKYRESIAPIKAENLSNAIIDRGDWFWGHNGRNMKWRSDLRGARRQIVELALQDLGFEDEDIAHCIADDFSDLRERGDNLVSLIPGCVDTLKMLKSKGIKLALLTNGSSRGQRSKIERFDLEPFFDDILIEEELGYGKPDPRIYLEALNSLQVNKENTWMIGDNPLWDVMAPQKIGIKGIWINLNRKNEPKNFNPFLKIGSLQEIKRYLE